MFTTKKVTHFTKKHNFISSTYKRKEKDPFLRNQDTIRVYIKDLFPISMHYFTRILMHRYKEILNGPKVYSCTICT